MIKKTSRLIGIVSTLALLLVGSDAYAALAGGTISYGPLPQSIPTLSGGMLAMLALLFAIVAFRAFRAHSTSKLLSSVAGIGALVLLAASGNQLIHDAYAPPSYNFSIATGGVVDLPPGLFSVQNISGAPQQIKSVAGYSCYSAQSTSPTQCSAGLVVQNNNACWVDFEYSCQR